VLPDSARIQEEDAKQANKHGYSKHAPALPLYTEPDAFRAISQFQPLGFNRPIEVAPGITIEFHQAGHLLGSAYILTKLAKGPAILFGGDLGRYNRPVLQDPADAVAADLVLCESTYGDREHLEDDNGTQLAEVIHDTARRGGKLIIPSFAIGRVEELLYWVRRLEQEQRIPILPVYVDSPMAAEALRYYSQRVHELDEDMRPTRKDVSAFATTRFQVVGSSQQSKALTASHHTAIVISSSGMATGGRVLHHMRAALPDERSTVLFVGYQAAGTRGRRLVDGDQQVKIHGQMVPVHARIAKIDSMSAHADRSEILRWLGTLPSAPGRLCLVHGEPGPMDTLKGAISQQFGWNTHTPQHRETIDL
jgi:metallo-beta-lactamase family protein